MYYQLCSTTNKNIYIQEDTFSNMWDYSKIYPASKIRGKTLKFLLSILCASKLTKQNNLRDFFPVDEIITQNFQDYIPVSIYLNSSGKSKKYIIEIRTSKNDVYGFLKLGTTELATTRLLNEADMLSCLPSGMAPKLLHTGFHENLYYIVLQPIRNSFSKVTIQKLIQYTNILVTNDLYDLYTHPWITSCQDIFNTSLQWLNPLANRKWPTALFHGDFSPWNIICAASGNIVAIDWELGNKKGFPILDLLYYFYIDFCLVKRSSPNKALKHVVKYIMPEILNISCTDIFRISRLLSWHVIKTREDDGVGKNDYAINWWKKLELETRQL